MLLLSIGGTEVARLRSGPDGRFEYETDESHTGKMLTCSASKAGYSPYELETRIEQENVTIDVQMRALAEPPRWQWRKVALWGGIPVLVAAVALLVIFVVLPRFQPGPQLAIAVSSQPLIPAAGSVSQLTVTVTIDGTPVEGADVCIEAEQGWFNVSGRQSTSVGGQTATSGEFEVPWHAMVESGAEAQTTVAFDIHVEKKGHRSANGSFDVGVSQELAVRLETSVSEVEVGEAAEVTVTATIGDTPVTDGKLLFVRCVAGHVDHQLVVARLDGQQPSGEAYGLSIELNLGALRSRSDQQEGLGSWLCFDLGLIGR